ncbi:two-component system response regulator AlgR [Povalibacter uvarum]|uniref:Two-component system response regulator AlgR n=1 Tax=Povalibacter uvarum TaxID=732238 RepID=A0A841HKX1_9GAMM|nr:LytTR family DNA-binding domain-containing protein [Povalibacter uvarum]MBB6092772.1 two-component system response regulator AlgR [Povalibacter uvarum]
MNLLIVDDEGPARERLRRLLEEIGDCTTIAEAGNGEEALAYCSEKQPDIVLLDVRMPGLSGIEVARHIDTLQDPPAVIFTTAYDQYAVEAFETEAVGYLLKPVRKEKLAHALRHAGRISPSRLVKVAQSAKLEHRREQICARLGDQLKLIPIADIYYFLADQKYITVRHKNGESLIDESLKALAEEFSAGFVRIHRNALVAENQISAVERTEEGKYSVRMRECGDVLEVSRRHAAELLRRIRGES